MREEFAVRVYWQEVKERLSGGTGRSAFRLSDRYENELVTYSELQEKMAGHGADLWVTCYVVESGANEMRFFTKEVPDTPGSRVEFAVSLWWRNSVFGAWEVKEACRLVTCSEFRRMEARHERDVRLTRFYAFAPAREERFFTKEVPA
jgi:hypothetical protein